MFKGYYWIIPSKRTLRALGSLVSLPEAMAITIWPFIFIHPEHLSHEELLRHEKIHIRQQLELLIVGAYILFLIEYLYARYIKKLDARQAYYFTALEQEAHRNAMKPLYLKSRKPYAVLKYVLNKKWLGRTSSGELIKRTYTRNTEKAFHWIIDILEDLHIPYQLSGGFSARLYGSPRELADIDICAPDEAIDKVAARAAGRIAHGPYQYLDDEWDLKLLTLEYEGQEIDIAGNNKKIFDKNTNTWVSAARDLSNCERMEVFGRTVSVIPKKDLIAYKSKILRDVDREDLRFLNTY